MKDFLLIIALLLIPLAIVAERADVSTWQSRLVLPRFITEPDRHTPIHATGTVVPPIVTTNLTLTPADNPVILVRETVIPAGVTVTLAAGTQLFAHEFSTLRVDGELVIRGTANQPVTLATNEQHPDNKIWNGIILSSGARANLTHAQIHDAVPALTCLPDSTLTTQSVAIKNTTAATFGCKL